MKKKNNIIIIILTTILLSCNNGEYHDKFVKDIHGNVYRLEHRLGRTYFIYKVEKKEIDSIFFK